ncbi:polymerase [Malaciobacter molluscorum LMG 25693]|uniref:O-antigen ligase family protein n=1 Tax=Malaciobacter molluscorum LMG 25693 TaxID=870501 RepID=A0A2G1DJR8_9BACT|nr:O-antigen ligase family protein [Malaciobacter molluscorum]AXX92912.1 O-antigen ligase family protein [Malaciobacter molluscorum LMG 25693]PHO18745.1 polymerase [Malaciobacter molluscorum LMG 25693]
MFRFLRAPSDEIQNKINLWLNHLLVIYSFLIPINNNAKSSLFFTMLVLFLYRRDYWFYLKEALSNKIVQAFLIFYLINAFGMLYTENIAYGKSHMDKIKYLLLPLMFLSFLDIRYVWRIVAAFVFGMFTAEIFSYLIHFGVLPYEFDIGKYEIWKTFPYSPAPFMNHGAHNVGLALVIAILLYNLLNKKHVSTAVKIFSLIFMTTATINMSFIASRVGYVLYIFIILVVIMLTFRKKIVKVLASTIIILSIISTLTYNYSNTVNYRVNQTINSIEKIINDDNYKTSVGLRIGFTKYSLDVIKENLLFGVGTGDHMDKVRAIVPEKHKYIDSISKPHNVYTQILLQIGLVGMIGFIYLIYSILSYKNTTKDKKDIMIIFTLAVLVFMLPGMLYDTFSLPLFVVFISAMIANKEYNIKYNKMNGNLLLKYIIFVILFLIIGITR